MLQHCRAAISLNNTGCLLLEQGSHQEAISTLKDAITIFTSVRRKRRKISGSEGTDTSAEPECANKSVTQEMIDSMLYKAVQAYSRETVAASGRANKRKSPSTTVLNVVSDRDLLQTTLDTTPSSSELHLIRIDEPDFEEMMSRPSGNSEDDGYGDLDVECAIVLHNLATSYLALSCSHGKKVNANRNKRRNLRKAARKVFHVAQTILFTRREAYCTGDSDGEGCSTWYCSKMLYVEYIVLCHLTQLSKAGHLDGLDPAEADPAEADTALDLYCEICNLRLIIQDIGDFERSQSPYQMITQTSAPAA